MEIPRNCSECSYTSICHASHYGGSKCLYEEAIKERTIEETLKEIRL